LTFAATRFQAIDSQAGTFYVERVVTIGVRGFIDCSGTIIVGELANVGGHRVNSQTQELDLERNCQSGTNRDRESEFAFSHQFS
jgi:hypothetical protein